MHVFIFGHSLIVGLDRLRNELCRGVVHQISFRGFPGGRVSTLIADFNHWTYVPDAVFLQIGENEVGVVGTEEIVESISLLCRVMSDAGVRIICVGSMLPRRHPRGLTMRQYNRLTSRINFELFRRLQELPNCRFCSYRDIRSLYWSSNGAHLSRRGYRWLFTRMLFFLFH